MRNEIDNLYYQSKQLNIALLENEALSNNIYVKRYAIEKLDAIKKPK
jgi:hypothetical protein